MLSLLLLAATTNIEFVVSTMYTSYHYCAHFTNEATEIALLWGARGRPGMLTQVCLTPAIFILATTYPASAATNKQHSHHIPNTMIENSSLKTQGY